jgi:archaellum component FlaC
MTNLHRLAQIREDLEEIRDNIQAILQRDDLRIIDWELEDMLKMVNIMLEGKIGKPNRKVLIRIRDRIEALREELDDIRQEVTTMSEELKALMEEEQ